VNGFRSSDLPFRIALAVGLAGQLLFMFGYSAWAEKKYPEHNSMAGFAGFMYGIPVGLLMAFAAYVATRRLLNRTGPH
jgi:hypothetical protein